jgi:predicted RNase H-like nuclease
MCDRGDVRVLGVDGRRGGWAVALVALRGVRATNVRWLTLPGQDADGFRAVLTLAGRHRAAAVGVDCPIGLPTHRWRDADLAAKAWLGRAAARTYLTPPRAVLTAPTYADARPVARAVLAGAGVSAQSYAIRGSVLAVDAALNDPPHPLAGQVLEVHPELSFMALAGRGPRDPLPSKKLPAGRAARLAALAGWWSGAARDDVPDGDDHLDALAAAWSAWRWATGRAHLLGGSPDDRGRPAWIVF